MGKKSPKKSQPLRIFPHNADTVRDTESPALAGIYVVMSSSVETMTGSDGRSQLVSIVIMPACPTFTNESN